MDEMRLRFAIKRLVRQYLPTAAERVSCSAKETRHAMIADAMEQDAAPGGIAS